MINPIYLWDGNKGKTGCGTALFLLSFFLCAAITSVFRSESTATTSVTQSGALTEILAPTAVPTPDTTYQDTFLRLSGPYINSIGELRQSVLTAAQFPVLLVDDEWKSELAFTMGKILAEGERIRALKPPSHLASVHRTITQATRHHDQMVLSLADGIDNLDAAAIQTAVNEMKIATELWEQALVEVEAMDSQPQMASVSRILPPHTPISPAAKRDSTRVNNNANLRAGPGTNYAIVGGASAGQVVEVVGRNRGGDWYQLSSGEWIATFLVNDAPPGLPVVTAQ